MLTPGSLWGNIKTPTMPHSRPVVVEEESEITRRNGPKTSKLLLLDRHGVIWWHLGYKSITIVIARISCLQLCLHFREFCQGGCYEGSSGPSLSLRFWLLSTLHVGTKGRMLNGLSSWTLWQFELTILAHYDVIWTRVFCLLVSICTNGFI